MLSRTSELKNNYGFLTFIKNKKTTTAHRISQEYGVSYVTTVQYLNKLHDLGLINRKPKTNKSRKIILTKKGELYINLMDEILKLVNEKDEII